MLPEHGSCRFSDCVTESGDEIVCHCNRSEQHVARTSPDGEEHSQRAHTSEKANSRGSQPPLERRHSAKDQRMKHLARVSGSGSVLFQSSSKSESRKRPGKTQRSTDRDCLPKWDVVDEEARYSVEYPIHSFHLGHTAPARAARREQFA
jgi:hypothetical protein